MKGKIFVTDMPKCKMRELLYLCTKSEYFKLNNKIYIQNDGIAMGPVLVNFFKVDLEIALITHLVASYLLGDFLLDNFHKSIKVTLEEEKYGKS